MAEPIRLFGEVWEWDTATAIWSMVQDPAYVDPDDHIIVVVAVEGDASGSINTSNFPGWTKIGRAVSGGAVTLELYFLFDASGNETGVEIAFGSAVRGTAISMNCRGAGGLTATFLAGSGANADPPAHTSYANGDHLWWTFLALDAQVVPSAGPSGWTEDIELAASVVSASISCARLEGSSGSSINPGAWTHAAEEWVAVTLGLGDVALGAPALPAAPSNLQAVAQGPSSIGLSFVDNANNETGFQIWRAPHVP